jgi:signal transduction histidine kinase
MSEACDVDLNRVIEQATASGPLFDRDANLPPIDLMLHLSPLPVMKGHRAELCEALINMIQNAVDAMPEGGRLIINSEWQDDTIQVTMTDTGIGMDHDTEGRIFAPLFTTKGTVGSGLGLSVVYCIIQRHGGRITVASIPHEGTSFTLSFPVFNT